MEHFRDIVTLLWVGFILSLIAAGIISEKIWAHQYRNRPCAHGTRLAGKSPALCPQCLQDAAERQRRDEELKQRLAAEEARRRADLEEQKRLWLEKARTVAFLQQLDPMVFQQLVWKVYKGLGWKVEETPFGRDGGVDGFVTRGSERLALQCKRYRADVGEPIVRDLYGAYLHHKATGAVLITTGAISGPAKEFAVGKRIQIYDGGEFISLLDQARLTASLVPDSFVLRSGSIPRSLQRNRSRGCPQCGSKLILKSGKYGQFFGCARWPNCSYTRDARGTRRN
jgi:restriction system protein